MKALAIAILLLLSVAVHAQEFPETEEDFRKEVLLLKTEVVHIQHHLYKSHERFKTGIAAATLGYTVTIAGGLMLGRKNDNLGKALLYTGGAIGLTGTVLLVDAFKFVGRAGRGEMHKKKH